MKALGDGLRLLGAALVTFVIVAGLLMVLLAWPGARWPAAVAALLAYTTACIQHLRGRPGPGSRLVLGLPRAAAHIVLALLVIFVGVATGGLVASGVLSALHRKD